MDQGEVRDRGNRGEGSRLPALRGREARGGVRFFRLGPGSGASGITRALYALPGGVRLSGEGGEPGLLEEYLERIHGGEWDGDRIMDRVYTATAEELGRALAEGYGKKLFGADWTLRDNNLLTRVQNNIFAFAGAKSLAEYAALRDAVYKDGKLQSLEAFKMEARRIDKEYNVRYLEVERQNVMASGTAGSRWVDIMETREEYPYLEYVTARDSRVREEHNRLDGIILPVEDTFWGYYYPPNGWRCRCSARKVSRRVAETRKGGMSSEEAQRVAGKVVAKPFRHNVGEAGMVFHPERHPYFKESPEAREYQLSATRNYGMRPVRDIYGNPDKPARYKGGIKTREDYLAWWAGMEKKHGEPGKGFTLVDKGNNIQAVFDNDLKKKLLDRGRHTYADEIPGMIGNTDELWATFKGSNNRQFRDEFFNVYMRYFEDVPAVLLVNKDGRVDSFYKLNNPEQAEGFRMGLLKKRKG